MTSAQRTIATALVSAAVLLAGCGELGEGTGTGSPWSAVPDSPLSARRSPVAAWVGDRFVVVGGWSDPMCPPTADCSLGLGAPLADGAAFDPTTQGWQRIADAPIGVAAVSTAVLEGTLYVLTAELGPGDAPAALLAFTPETDGWTSLPLPPGEPSQLVAAGAVLIAVAGSDEVGMTVDHVFEPTMHEWRELPDDPLGPSFDRQAVWLGDRVLLAAKDLVPSPGSEHPAVVRLAELDLDLMAWGPPSDTEVIGSGPVAVNGRVVFPGTGSADGGQVNNWGRSYPEGGVYDPAGGSWEALPVPGGMAGAPMLLPNIAIGHHVIVGDGLLDPVTGGWDRLPGFAGNEVYEQGVAGNEDTLFVWGGATLDRNVADGYLLRP